MIESKITKNNLIIMIIMEKRILIINKEIKRTLVLNKLITKINKEIEDNLIIKEVILEVIKQ